MIQLNVDFTLLNKFFGIPINRILQYANKDIEEIMELEAAQGNQKAAEYKQILSDPDKIYEIFKLANVENKLIILQNMSEDDIDKLLPYLTQEQLAKGLNFFNEDKLMEFASKLPIEEIATMILEEFSLVDVLSLMDEEAMNNFIMEPEVERKYAQNYFESLNQKALEKIMVQSFGIEFKDKKRDEYLEHLENMDFKEYKNFLLSMQRESKIGLINGIVEQKPDLVYLFEAKDLIAPMDLLMKEYTVKLMSKLDSEFLIPMIQELPLDLTQIVLTQIDSNDFAEILASDFQDILSSVVLFSNKAA